MIFAIPYLDPMRNNFGTFSPSNMPHCGVFVSLKFLDVFYMQVTISRQL